MILKAPVVTAICFVGTNSPGSSDPVNLYRPSSAACGRHLPRRGRLRSFPSGRCVAQRMKIKIAAGGSYTIKSDAGSAQPRLMRGSRDRRDWKARANSYYPSSNRRRHVSRPWLFYICCFFGNVTVNFVKAGLLSTATVPPWSSTTRLTTARPMPLPSVLWERSAW